MISDIFVLSPRGDTILSKMYRSRPEMGAHERSHTEAFFRKVKFWDGMSSMPGLESSLLNGGKEIGSIDYTNTNQDGRNYGEENGGSLDSSLGVSGGAGGETKSWCGDAPPVFLMPDGQSYFHVKRNGLIFGCATAKNVSPCTVIELLSRIAKVFKDYCGTLSEEAIRKNFILLYELLDEMVDYGYPQVTRTENLKAFVYNEPILVSPVADTSRQVNPKTASASAVHKPVIGSVTQTGKSVNAKEKNEIFVDILEKLNVVFSNNGYVLNSTIDGCIQMKSYLAGNPELRLALNEDLVIGRNNLSGTNNYGSVVLDDCSFHDCVNLTEFEHARTLSFFPPDGEFVVLHYRVTGEYSTPFRIFPSIEETGPKTFEITLLVRAEMDPSHFGANLSIELPLPKSTASASCHLITSPNVSNANADYVTNEKKIVWTMKKFPGGTEQTCKIKVLLDTTCTSHMRREIGPVNMNFEIPMFNVSKLNVRYLRIAENIPGYTPYRW
eukprot:CAMPEP_0184855210 /NCGR_PEP_ID=MMETSP0580-20130426/517_1 /TAXON_ID=1118495 /ORGANISM="Dactyliosolen fragilissimus" /LENGTH=496 /DNA_ID=CAMNT_0027349665 /DNA_START=62 /DNA_END=1549 /DNA_ORIENTATION=-